MSSNLKKGELFVKEVVARIKGDDAEAKASKIARKAISAIDVQIATLKGKVVEAEVNVESKEESLKAALYPTEVFSNNQIYCENIRRANEAFEAAKDELEDLNASIKFFEGVLAKF
jgi:formylmethanofuran:tetrahydromethanopterin formyltransferase